MFEELSISTQSGRKIAGVVSSRAAYSLTAAAPPPSETEADDAAFSFIGRFVLSSPPDFPSPSFWGASVEVDEERSHQRRGERP